MKRLSRKCKKYAKIISIIDVRILKQTISLNNLKKELASSESMVQSFLEKIGQAQETLRSLVPGNSYQAIQALFNRRRSVCSLIESLYFDMSIYSQKCDELREKIAEEQKIIILLENKKEAWEYNLKNEIRAESYAG